MKQQPINLTEAAGRMPWPEVQQALRVCASLGGCTLAVEGRDRADIQQHDGLLDTVYIIVSGFGVLHAGAARIECTDGDVVFVPRGHPHRFERLDNELRLWRITLAADQIAQCLHKS